MFSPQQALSKDEKIPASFRASSWARENEGIGIAVVLGDETSLRPDALAENFKDGFRVNFGVPVEVFIDTKEGRGAAIAYYYGEHATNPEPFQTGTTIERMEDIVSLYRVHVELSD